MADGQSREQWTAEQVHAQLRHHATLVRPGETLVILAPEEWSPAQLVEAQEWLSRVLDDLGKELRILILPGRAFGIAVGAEVGDDEQPGQADSAG